MLSLFAAACRSPSAKPVLNGQPSVAPPTILLRGGNLAAVKSRLLSGDASLRPAYDALLRDARAALTAGPFSVTQKGRVAPSGDRHDYMSLAPYWWPDPTKPSGLPFIRRDGEVNPESRSDTDSPRFGQMSDAVETLSLAYYFSGDETYAGHAAMLLRTWFLDSTTRMNPNLRYAQAIPGVTDGRGIGIIDLRNMSTIVDDVLLLRTAPAWGASDEAAMRDWCRAYLTWLLTSAQGKEEDAQRNNHGTWYDAQVATLALFVGDTALARRRIGESAKARLASEIAPDGRQPNELSRTRSLHYSLFNIDPFARLAELGRLVGVDLWHFEASNGASLRKAVMFVAPYFDPKNAWPGQELTPAKPRDFLRTMRQASLAYSDPALNTAIRAVGQDVLQRDRSRLLYPKSLGEGF